MLSECIILFVKIAENRNHSRVLSLKNRPILRRGRRDTVRFLRLTCHFLLSINVGKLSCVGGLRKLLGNFRVCKKIVSSGAGCYLSRISTLFRFCEKLENSGGLWYMTGN